MTKIIGEVCKEEMAGLYFSAMTAKEPPKYTETDRRNFGGSLPLHYYNYLAEDMANCEATVEFSAPPPDPSNPFLTKEITHPSMNNRPTSWPITVKSSMAKDMQEDVIDITVNALEKFTWASPDIAHFMKIELDEKFGCSWHVVVGEDFGFDMTFESGHMMYIFYGSLGVLLWKCGTQLLKEAKYRSLDEEEEKKKKLQLSKMSKYKKVVY